MVTLPATPPDKPGRPDPWRQGLFCVGNVGPRMVPMEVFIEN